MEDHVIDSKCSHKNVLTWQEMLESGKSVENAVLEEREENQAVNHACALSYTSGTTGPPKGKKNLCFHLCLLLFSLLHLFIYCVLLFVSRLLFEATLYPIFFFFLLSSSFARRFF